MNSKKIIGCFGAATLAVGLSAGPVLAAGAASSSEAVSSAKVVAAKHASPARKKKKIKIAVSVAPNPAGCYNIAGQVLRKGAPIPGAVLKIESLHKGRWSRTSDAPFSVDANGAFSFVNAGLHKPSGAASKDKIRFRYKKSNYSKAFRAPCAASYRAGDVRVGR